MSDRGKEVLGPEPGEDPWEFEWPDDAQEQRRAEREAAQKAAEIKPAPRFFTAYITGVWTVLAFVMVITLVAQVPVIFLRLVSPIALIGLLAALPLGYILNVLTRNLGRGFISLVFMLVGGFVGYYWSYMIVTWLFEQDGIDIGSASSSDRMATAILFMTATATAFVVARNLTDTVRKHPRAVFIATITLLILFIPSTIQFGQDLAAYWSRDSVVQL